MGKIPVDDNFNEVLRKAAEDNFDGTKYNLRSSQRETVFVDSANSTTTPLNSSAEFTGDWTEATLGEVVITITADQDCTYKVQFSPDGSSLDSTLTFYYRVGEIEQPKRIVVTRRYYRVVITNTSTSNMTYLRVQLLSGHFNLLTTPLNGTITADHGAIVTRNIPFDIEIGLQRYASFSSIDKFGENPSVSTSGNADVWEGTGLYSGFPTSSPEEFQIVLSDAGDIGGSLIFYYLPSSTSTYYRQATVVTTGATTNTGITGYRMLRGRWDGTNSATPGVNAGTVTVRWATTTSVVFSIIQVGTGQTRIAGYTVPAQCVGLLRQMSVDISKSNTSTIRGSVRIIEPGKTPVYIHPFSSTQDAPYSRGWATGINLPAGTDFIIYIRTCSSNNTDVFGSMEILINQLQTWTAV